MRAVDAVAVGIPIEISSAFTGEGIGRVSARIAGSRTAARGLVGRGQIDADQPADRGGADGDQRDPRRRPRAAHDHPPRADRAARGGCIIDTPGMRVMQLWEAAEGSRRPSTDIEELAAECRFRDCAHETEPGCAVQAAIAAGTLPARAAGELSQAPARDAVPGSRDDKRARRLQEAVGRRIQVDPHRQLVTGSAWRWWRWNSVGARLKPGTRLENLAPG